MDSQVSLIGELEQTLNTKSQDERVAALRRLTDLFLGGSDHFDTHQIEVFDNVIGHLIDRIETAAKAELSGRLAPKANAPIGVIRRLAHDDEITVAGPVLSQSERLTSDDLVEIAKSKSQQHLLAISSRSQLAEAVTDVLVDRGDQEVVHTLARNAGARFSNLGFSSLVRRAEGDDRLAEGLGLRVDVPPALLQQLLTKASETVRSRLMQQGTEQVRGEIQRIVDKITVDAQREASKPRNYDAAVKRVALMEKEGSLNEAAITGFLDEHKRDDLVAGLSTLCGASIELTAALVNSPRNDGLLVACKAAGLKWPTVTAVLKGRFIHDTTSEQEIKRARSDYLALSQANAQRTLRFWQVRAGTQGGAAPSNR